MTKTFYLLIFLLAASGVFAAPAPFELPNALIVRAPKNLRSDLQKSKVNTPAYTLTAMKILEDRIQKRMRLLEFSLNNLEAIRGMASAETYSVSDMKLQPTTAERKKIFSDKDLTALFARYNKSFKVRQETIRLFRECKPFINENRFQSTFFSLLEFQHIYLEQELLKSLKRSK